MQVVRPGRRDGRRGHARSVAPRTSPRNRGRGSSRQRRGVALAFAIRRPDASADATGTAAHFRLYDSAGTTCHLQGTVTATGGGGDMTVDSVSFTAGQQFTVTSFTLTDGNA